MDSIIKDLNGKILEKILIKNIINPLNPTVCFIIEPPNSNEQFNCNNNNIFSIPGTNYNIIKNDSYYFSNEVGFLYPIIKKIPILKTSAAILASALSTDL